MDEVEWLKKIDIAASRGPGGRIDVDVADRVVETLRGPMRFQTVPRLQAPASLWIATGLSWAAAAACLLIALQSVTQLQDPFSDLFNPLRMVLR